MKARDAGGHEVEHESDAPLVVRPKAEEPTAGAEIIGAEQAPVPAAAPLLVAGAAAAAALLLRRRRS